jgi:hypothetical protein
VEGTAKLWRVFSMEKDLSLSYFKLGGDTLTAELQLGYKAVFFTIISPSCVDILIDERPPT